MRFSTPRRNLMLMIGATGFVALAGYTLNQLQPTLFANAYAIKQATPPSVAARQPPVPQFVAAPAPKVAAAEDVPALIGPPKNMPPVETTKREPDHPAGYRLWLCHPSVGCQEPPDQRQEYAARWFCESVVMLTMAKYKERLRYNPNEIQGIEARCIERDPRWPPISPERRAATGG